jgi:hypothetical protein
LWIRRPADGAAETSPANVIFVAAPKPKDGRRIGWLMHESDGAPEPIICRADISRTSSSTASTGLALPPASLEIHLLEQGQIGLKSGGFYLSAEQGGQVTLSRTACNAWERFVPAEDWHALLRYQQRFAQRRVIVLRHRGNLANKLLQYMGALTIASRIKDCRIVNVSIPEWGIEIPDDTQDQIFLDNVDLWSWDPFRPHTQELAAVANGSESIRIMMADHLLRMEFLLGREFYAHLLPKTVPSSYKPTDEDLIINIRSGEILSGVPHYPLLPVAFYEEILARTGLKPVFVGQLSPSGYVNQIKERFPDAVYIDSRGAAADFELLRSAKNIVVAVSTFSWLAAWLSEARTIILPLSGFLNPAHHREVDLLPMDDIRYRFFLFPLNYGLPEEESLRHHERMKGHWKEISRNQVAILKSGAPFLRAPREAYDNGLPARSARGAQIAFDPVWYAHQYLDAAMEVSEGWFEDPLHHYLEIGRLRGYLPTRPMPNEQRIDLTLPNLALNRRATQSSLSRASRGATLEEDAARAVNGRPWEEYGFHTNEEDNPWWMVDLGSVAHVHSMRIFNIGRMPDSVQRRASPLVAEASNDGREWRLLFRTAPGQIFGGYTAGRPLLWSAPEPVEAQFVRLSIPRREMLHLAAVEIYGTERTGGGEIRSPAPQQVST